ncbi:MAG: Spy/CpxP family protein refolding chaperone [Parvibaculum sedimenti]|uniref:Spy/CpxP family protein refolding chaperone n=1 Tax=Parvibaculum sedimenti TaxID=2608632 RepID=UPI003BB54C44
MSLRAFVFIGLLALPGASVAIAQETPSPQQVRTSATMGSSPDSGMMMGGCDTTTYGASAAESANYGDSRIALLKSGLKITDAQEPVWNDYANALRATSEVMASMRKQMIGTFEQNDRSSMTVHDLHIDAMSSRLPALEALRPATIALYKALSDEQKKKADALLPAMECI